MSALLTVLSNILRLATLQSSKQHPLQITPTQLILRDIFDQHPAATRIERVAAAVGSYAPNGYEALVQITALAATSISDHTVEQKLQRAAAALDEMLALQYLLRPDAITTSRLHVTTAYFFDYLQTLVVEPPGEPPIILVGQLVGGQPQLELPISKERLLLRYTAIAYEASDAYPRLSFRFGSTSKEDDRKEDRREWRQLADSSYDLTIQHRDISGRIETRSLTLPYTLNSTRLVLTIGPAPETILLRTTVMDRDDRPLLTCLRAYRSMELR